MKKLILIMGKSGSGKDTILNALCERGIGKVIPYTTRPMRPGEKEGNPYHFVDDKEFDSFGLSCVTSYKTTQGIWKYGYNLTDTANIREPVLAMVVTPVQAEEIAVNYWKEDIELYPFYIMTDETERLQHLILRESQKKNPDCAEIYRRLTTDKKDFRGIEQRTFSSKHVETIYNNYKLAPDRIAEEIIYRYFRELVPCAEERKN